MTTTDREKILFLDIETVPLTYRYNDLDGPARDHWNRKWQHNKEVPPEQQYARAGIYAEFAKVVCVGTGQYKGGKFHLRTISSSDEKEVLQNLSDLLNASFNTDKHLLCAHNGKEFDFPFLCRRMIINGIPLPRALRLQGLKPWNIAHIDTMELWKFGDVKNFTSLALLAHVLNIPSPKDDMDGSMVGKTFYEDNDLPRIARYCGKDVVTLARVYNRFAGHANLVDDDVIFA